VKKFTEAREQHAPNTIAEPCTTRSPSHLSAGWHARLQADRGSMR
jgi:hypothetical protein